MGECLRHLPKDTKRTSVSRLAPCPLAPDFPHKSLWSDELGADEAWLWKGWGKCEEPRAAVGGPGFSLELGAAHWRLGYRGDGVTASAQLKTDDWSSLRTDADGLPNGGSFSGCAVTLYCTLVYPAVRTELSTTQPDVFR